jgi:capsular polysaccharide transport system ATP-binding protein
MIQIEDVTKVYPTRRGPRLILDRINLSVRKGEKVGILGRNGAGKSTLVRLIGGAELPSTGRIRRGISVSWPLAFGGAFQPHMTGTDNVRFVCRVYGVDHTQVLPRVEAFAGLGLYLYEPVVHYSSGMQARLAFALSIAIEFDCFLIDETIAVGDVRFHEKCNEELFEKRKDRAFIIVSHDLKVIRAHCERAAVITAGKLHLFDDIEEAIAFHGATISA